MRRIVMLAVFLLLGAIVNVAVALLPLADWLNTRVSVVNTLRGAWSCSEFQQAFGARLVMWPSSASQAASSGASVEPLKQRLDGYASDCLEEAELIHRSSARDRVQFVLVCGRGYPMLALRGSVIVVDVHRTRALPTRDLRPMGAVLFYRDEPEFLYLPAIPIWPGFAVNTVLYTAVLWLLSVVAIAARRRRRIRRGVCPECAYDLRGRGKGSEACPECGAAATRHAPQHA